MTTITVIFLLLVARTVLFAMAPPTMIHTAMVFGFSLQLGLAEVTGPDGDPVMVRLIELTVPGVVVQWTIGAGGDE